MGGNSSDGKSGTVRARDQGVDDFELLSSHAIITNELMDKRFKNETIEKNILCA